MRKEQWIKVSEGLPHYTYNDHDGVNHVEVLVFNGYIKNIAYFAWNSYEDKFYWLFQGDTYQLNEITHWMYLPENPS